MVYKNFQKHGLGQIRISWKNIYPWRLVRSLLTWTLPRTAQRVIPWLCTLEWPPPGWTWTPMVLWPSSCGSSSPGVTTDWPGTRITIKRSRCSGKNMSFYFLQTSITRVCMYLYIKLNIQRPRFEDHVSFTCQTWSFNWLNRGVWEFTRLLGKYSLKLTWYIDLSFLVYYDVNLKGW